MELDARQTVILAILVLFLGRTLNRRISSFQYFNIPEPVTGGVLVSLIFAAIYFVFDFSVSFSLLQRDVLLIVFFTCVGLSSKFSTLMQGGKALVVLLVLAIIYLIIQNLTGIGVATATGLSSQVGVLGGSVSLSGGHGTAIAWSPIFIEKYGIENAAEIGIACATFGLVLGGVIGGPLANFLIKKHNLKSNESENVSVGVEDEQREKITVESIFSFLFILAIAIGIGIHLHEFLVYLGIQLPVFVPCIFGGILLTNTIPVIWKSIDWPTGKPTLALTSEVCLGLFLAMSLMSLQLWTLIELALPIMLLLTAQVVVVSVFAAVVIFRFLGKNYDAAVISSGYAGLALGATPTAIANMTAVTKQHGASPTAFIIIPLVGAFFIDIANALVIQNMLQVLG